MAARGERLPERHWIDRFAALLPARAAILDLGCGAGVPLARYLAGLEHRITGIDSSPTMIAQFRANLPGMTARVADMRELSLETRFDGLVAWDSFFHLSHDAQRAMFGIFRDHAALRAPLIFTSGTDHGEAIGTLEGEPLYHASLATEEYRELLEAHDFAVIAHCPHDERSGGRTVWLARYRG